MAVSRSQFFEPVVPHKWSEEEKRYAQQVEELFTEVFAWRDTLVNKFWPVGSLFATENTANPKRLMGGEWDSLGVHQIAGKALNCWIRKG